MLKLQLKIVIALEGIIILSLDVAVVARSPYLRHVIFKIVSWLFLQFFISCLQYVNRFFFSEYVNLWRNIWEGVSGEN